MASRNLPHRDASGQTRAESSTPLHQVGQTLKRARESQGLSLQQLAETLHMGNEQLQALESGDRDHLAETVFVKATVRRVANKLKVDPDPLIAALHDLDGAQQGRALRSPAKPAQDDSSTSSAEPTSNHSRGVLRLASGAAALLAAIAAGWSWNQGTLRPHSSAATSSITDAISSQPKETPTSQRPISPPTDDNTITIVTREPSWVALRDQKGALLFEGMVDQEKTIDTSQAVEIYAGRPDLVSLKRAGQQSGPLGPIDQVRWYRISATPAPPDPNQ